MAHQEGMRRVLGPQYGSPYLKLIVMCVESCFLIVVNSMAFVVLFASGDRTRFGGSDHPAAPAAAYLREYACRRLDVDAELCPYIHRVSRSLHLF